MRARFPSREFSRGGSYRSALGGLFLGALICLGWAAPASAATRVAPGIYLERVGTGPASPEGSAELRNGSIQPRIVGGDPVTSAQRPWQVAIALAPGTAPGTGYDRLICGGTLVSPTLVVSAAHCFYGEGGFQPAADYSVISGRTTLSSNEGRETLLAGYYSFVNGQGQQAYDPRTAAWDVVLIELAQPALGSPVKLAGADEGELWAPGRAAYVSGWGATSETGGYPDQLRSAEIAILPNRFCQAAYRNGWDPTTSLCAGTALGISDSCQGDSGGPLVVPIAGGGFRLVGDVQFGNGCGRTYFPGVYGRLGADPVRAALQNAAVSVAGENIVGSGALPPETLTPRQAKENAWIYLDEDCLSWRPCRRYKANSCVASGLGYRCAVSEFAKNRRYGKFRCKRRVFVTGEGGTLEVQPLKKWKCRRGW
jgi:hypothetical protein